ncbi:MAG: TolC family protein [Bacteroidales bacterium]|nr:TolC family protein [Bacteroidales bacterium]
MKKHKIIILSLWAASVASAQDLDFSSFMQQVKENNIGLVARQYDIDIATANVQAAKVFNDPELSFSYADNEDRTMQMGKSFESELSYNFSLGNVRKARIRSAQAEKALAEASVAEYFRNLKADAAICYHKALYQKHYVAVLRTMCELTTSLAAADSIRLAVGDVSETDALQSKLEAQAIRNTCLQEETNLQNATAELLLLMGGTCPDSLVALTDSLTLSPQTYLLDRLLADAEQNRADLLMAVRAKTLSEKNLRLISANRAMEMELSIGYAHNTIVKNEIAPAPAHNSVSVGVSFPLKFSSMNRGEVKAAQWEMRQREADLEATRQQIRTEVTQAYNSYHTALTIARQLTDESLHHATTILRNRTFAYTQGETRLIEVIEARRTYQNSYQAYYEALLNVAIAQIEMERACGM